MAVLKRGTAKGFITWIPMGGQIQAISTDGDREEWKKAQKKPKKKHISETINKINPDFNPFWTFKVWQPWKVPSSVISSNQLVNP